MTDNEALNLLAGTELLTDNEALNLLAQYGPQNLDGGNATGTVTPP